MTPADVLQTAETQYKLSNLLFGLLLVGLAFLGLYILWRWCSDDDKSSNRTKNVITMKPVYAHEIEPGIVVIQSEDGEYFRILKEYDSATSNKYGALSKPNVTSTTPTAQEHTLLTASGYSASSFAHAPIQTHCPPTAPIIPLEGAEIVEFECHREPPPYAR